MEPISELNCIVCLQVHDIMVYLYHDFEDLQTSLLHLLETCGGLKVIEESACPKYLCKICTNELLIAAKFREKCLQSQNILENYKRQFEKGGTINEADLIEVDYGEKECLPNEYVEKEKMENEFLELSSETEILDSTLINDSPNIKPLENKKRPQEEVPGYSDITNAKESKYKAIACCKCGAYFQQSINLAKHLHQMHGVTQSYSCPKCQNVLTSEAELQQHICYSKNNTTISNKNKCSSCYRVFPTQFTLRLHLRTHTGGKPFKCKFCKNSFKTQTALTVHRRKHMSQAGFKCTVCKRGFLQQRYLLSDMHIHTSKRLHTCTVCKKSFSRNFLLGLHGRIHTGEQTVTRELE